MTENTKTQTQATQAAAEEVGFVNVKVNVERLNDAFRAAPRAVIDLLYSRFPVPDALKSYVPERDDGKMSPIGLLNQSLFDGHFLCGLFDSTEQSDNADASGFRGFDMLSTTTRLDGRSDIKATKRSTVPVYYLPQVLFNRLWDTAARYAPPEELEEIQRLCTEFANVNPLNPDGSETEHSPIPQ